MRKTETSTFTKGCAVVTASTPANTEKQSLHTRAYTSTHAHIHTHARTHAHTRAPMQPRTHTYTNAHTNNAHCTQMPQTPHTRTHSCTHIHTRTHTHAHTHTYLCSRRARRWGGTPRSSRRRSRGGSGGCGAPGDRRRSRCRPRQGTTALKQ